MCTLDTILQTKQEHVGKVPTGKKGMSTERIKYNTNLIFSIAKEKGLPLDEVLRKISSGKSKILFDKAFEMRKKTSFNNQVLQISSTI